MSKKIIIVGAGPGGLTAGMILSRRGYQVEIYEKADQVGGRNGVLAWDGFKFDIGPTFLMMKFILEEVFSLAGRSATDYLEIVKLDPMYRLYFTDEHLDISSDQSKLRQLIAAKFPGNEAGFDNFYKKEKKRYQVLVPCLQRPYQTIGSLFNKNILRAVPHVPIHKTMYDVLTEYFSAEKLRLAFTFQSKYLGMAPWTCPAVFMMIPYVEHAFGIYHVQGGLSEISVAMARVIKEYGGRIYLNSTVREVIVEGRQVQGIVLKNGEKITGDAVVMNADFAYAMSNLIPANKLKKWNKKNLPKKNYSCSTFMLYLGLDKLYDLPHHNIIFSKDYHGYINKIESHQEPDNDVSIYIRNASVTDASLAPAGHSNVYILVPVTNNRAGLDWETKKSAFRQDVLQAVDRVMPGIKQHIVAEKIITPDDWEKNNVFLGATFNLSHELGQMLYFRPHNQFEELDNMYIVGGGTHPGSGLPTIYESGRISADLISQQLTRL